MLLIQADQTERVGIVDGDYAIDVFIKKLKISLRRQLCAALFLALSVECFKELGDNVMRK